MASPFVHLHSHSEYSLHRGCVPLDSLIQRASEYGYDALALTDANNLYGAVEFFEKCTEQDIKPIIGTELKKGRDSVVLLARNRDGYRYLCRAVTSLQCEPESSLDKIVIENSPEGVFAVVFSMPMFEKIRACIQPPHLLAGIRPADTVSAQYRTFMEYALQHNVQPLACADSYMLCPEQQPLCSVLRAIEDKTAVNRIEPPSRSGNPYFFGPDKAQEMFKNFPRSTKNTRRIADRCEFEFDFSQTFFPECTIPAGETAFSHLYKICHNNLSLYYSPITSKTVQRLARELAVIEKSEFSEYFLIVREIMQYAKHHDIPVSVRGSGASSLITYILGISDVDPIRYDLQFERFLNASRTDCPDLDIDICWRRRDELIEYVYEKYGRDRTAMISTHNRYHARSAFKDVALASGVSTERVNYLSKRMERDRFPSVKDLLSLLPGSMACPGDTELFGNVLEYSRAVDGLPHHLSIHCGGVVIAPSAITDYLPLEKASKGILITQFEMNAVEKTGLVKMDLLGQRGLSTVSETVRRVRERHGRKIRMQDIPDRDPETSGMIRQGKTIGCTQIESPGMRSLIRMLEAYDISTLTAALALIRPGAAGAGKKASYVRRHRRNEPYETPLSCLKDSCGIMLYQEDIMRVVHEAAGLPLDAGERIRKLMNKRIPEAKRKQIRDYFIKRAMRRMPRHTASALWRNIEQFTQYSFCKAHAVVCGSLAYRAAWLKKHYPVEYMTAVMNNHTGMYPRSAYIEEARRIGVQIYPPDANKSGADYITDHSGMRVGMGEIKGVSSTVLDRIIEQRNIRLFNSPEDFFERVRPAHPESENLIQAGALDRWNIPRPVLIWIAHNITSASAFGFPGTEYPALPDYSESEKMEYEYEVLGFVCSRHPVSFMKEQGNFPDAVPCSLIHSHIGRTVSMAGMGITARSARTNKNEIMGFMTLEDDTGTVEITLPPGCYRKHRCQIHGRGPFLIRGKAEERYGSISVIAGSIEPV